MSERIESRRHPRVQVRLRTVYHDEIDPEESDSLMSNLSLGGCFIRTSRLLPPGSVIHVKFKLPDSDHEIRASAVVRWVQDSSVEEERGMGIQFKSIRQSDLLLLKQFIGKKLESTIFG